MDHGSYSSIARDYAAHRAGYAPEIAELLRASAARSAQKRASELDVADVGAGTGIWTRELARGVGRVLAIEPDDAMRALGAGHADNGAIEWRPGRAERTGLPAASCDLVTMASAFHWADFEAAIAELARVLRPGGWFAALWNTRVLDGSPLLLEIEAELRARVPGYVPRSSGRSAFCASLASRLEASGRFARVRYDEAHHVERFSPERYAGIWRSVNDARVQAGEAAFAEFLAWVEQRTRGERAIEARYATRCWSARTA